MTAPQIQQYIIFPTFFFVVGCAIGSFLNVVIWRLPNRGQNVTFRGQTRPLTLSWPPSHCPKCHNAIPLYLNVPVLGWLFLRGRCARCGERIAIRYPLVELATGMLFVALYVAYFVANWQANIGTLTNGWPTFALHLLFVCCLLAAAAIDADWYIIPLSIPILLGVVAVASAPFITSPGIPRIDPRGVWALPAVGAAIGLVVGNVLLRAGILPMSFAELLEKDKDDKPAANPPRTKPEAQTNAGAKDAKAAAGEPKITPPPELTRKLPSVITAVILIAAVIVSWLTLSYDAASVTTLLAAICIFLLGVLPRDAGSVDVTDEVVAEINVPNARGEIMKEVLFLLFPLAGAFAGWLAWRFTPAMLPDTPWMGRLAGVLLGALVGGGVVWGVRVFGSLLFGKEAMGLGDVHLMAAVGAVLGAPVTILAFFVATFMGMIFGILLILLRKPNVLPFGPWLSMASIICVIAGGALLKAYLIFVGFMPAPPPPGLGPLPGTSTTATPADSYR